MSQFDSVISSIKSAEYSEKTQLLLYVCQGVQKSGNRLVKEDKSALLAFAFDAVTVLPNEILTEADEKKRDIIAQFADLTLHLIAMLCPDPSAIDANKLGEIKFLYIIAEREHYIEFGAEKLFSQKNVDEAALNTFLALVPHSANDFKKNKLYGEFLHHERELGKLTDGAKQLFCAYLTEEVSAAATADALTEDALTQLESAVDLACYVADAALLDALEKLVKRGHSNINCYAVRTLLAFGRTPTQDAIDALAKDLVFADLSYLFLSERGKQSLFPSEYATEEYLAKSNLVHWLTYPTELGKAPDAIEYIGRVKPLFKKEVYHVFKFRSGSDTLAEEQKDKWLIGWSSRDGGTFSNFDEYAPFEKPTVKATLKNIQRKLIG